MNKKTYIIIGVLIALILLALLLITLPIANNKKEKVDNDKNNSEEVKNINLGTAGYGDNIIDLEYDGNDIKLTLNNNSTYESYITVDKTPSNLEYTYEMSNEGIVEISKEGTIKTLSTGSTEVIAKSIDDSNIESNKIIINVVDSEINEES